MLSVLVFGFGIWRNISTVMHSIVLERYSIEEAQYCGGEGPVLITKGKVGVF